MEENLTQLEVEEQKGDSIFSSYYTRIEEVKLNQEFAEAADILEKAINVLDRTLVDINTDERYESLREDIQVKSIGVLQEWYPHLYPNDVGNIFPTIEIMEALAYNFLALSNVIFNCYKEPKIVFARAIQFLKPSRIDRVIQNEIKHKNFRMIYLAKDSGTNRINLGNLKTEEGAKTNAYRFRIEPSEISEFQNFTQTQGYVFRPHTQYTGVGSDVGNLIFPRQLINRCKEDFFGLKNLLKALKTGEIEQQRKLILAIEIIAAILNDLESFDLSSIFVWDIDIELSASNPNGADAAFLLWTITEVIKNLEDTEVYIDSCRVGSFMARIRAFFKSPETKEEFKEIVEKSFKAAKARYLDKPIVEGEKTQAEVDKLKKESDAIIDKDSAIELHGLQIQDKKLDLQLKALEVEKKKIEVIKGFSELMTSGILRNDSPLSIKINDILVFQQNGTLISSSDEVQLAADNQLKIDPSMLKEGKIYLGDPIDRPVSTEVHDTTFTEVQSDVQTKVEILSAKYGADGDIRDVSQKIKGLISNGILEFRVGNWLVDGPEPKMGKEKTLELQCIINGQPKVLIGYERETLKIE